GRRGGRLSPLSSMGCDKAELELASMQSPYRAANLGFFRASRTRWQGLRRVHLDGLHHVLTSFVRAHGHLHEILMWSDSVSHVDDLTAARLFDLLGVVIADDFAFDEDVERVFHRPDVLGHAR